jgi:hypothetical protein
MAVGDLQFAFDPSRGETPETIAKKRMLAEAIMGKALRAPKDVGEGLSSIGQAIMYRKLMGETGKAESEGRSGASKVFESIFGGGQFPAAPASPEGGMGASASARPDDQNVGSTIDFARSEAASGGAGPIREGLVARGLPEHVADAFVMNFQDESGLNPGINEAAPIVPGSRGGFGLAQWTGPRRKALEAFAAERGVPVSDTDAQLDFLMTELQGPEAGAFEAIMGAPDKGSAAAAIVNQFLRPAEEHRARRVARYTAGGEPTQVASLDPSIGMPAAQPEIPGGGLAAAAAEQGLPADNPGIAALARLQEQEAAPQQAGVSFTPPMPAQAPQPAMAPAGPAPAQQKVAQAIMGGDAGPWGASASQADASARGGPGLQQLIQAASDPWMSDGQRAVLNSMIQRQLESSDPAAQLQRRKLELELKNLENPKAEADWSKLDDNSLFNQRTGETKDIVAPGGTGAFRFEGTSVEAQALNGLMDSGQITPEQAQQLGAGKTITNPADGSMMFLTPQGVFGQAGGSTPQPISPPPLGAPTEVPVAPETVPPAEAGPEIPVREGVIPLTPGKANMPTDTQRNRKASVNQAFDALTGELDRYAELVGQTGIEAAPGEAKDNLNAVRQGVMLQLKELFNLGVLNGPDLSLMEKMIYDPVVDLSKEGGIANLPDQIVTSLTGGAGDRAENSVAELKRMLGNIKASVGGTKPPMGTNDLKQKYGLD